MKKFYALLVAALFGAASIALAADNHGKDQSSKKDPVAKAPDSAWLAKARAEYPLTICVASDEKLGGSDDVVEYVHKENGKADRLVRLCCEGCIDDFKKEPAKYLAKIDEAAMAKAKKK